MSTAPKGTDTDLVLYEVRQGVATLSFNNPERRNAWSVAMEQQYFELLDEATQSNEVRAIVVTGHGNSFCPGLDTTKLQQTAESAGFSLAGRRPQHYALTVPKPMIAAVNGACAGVGLVQALVCDVRFVSRGAKMSTALARRGLAAEYGLSWLLPRMIGLERALDLLLSARTFDAEEAYSIGLASRLCDRETVLAEATDYALDLAANCSPRSMAAIRRQVWGDLSRGYSEANAEWLAVMYRFNVDNPDFVEGVSSFRERRPPVFPPLSADIELPAIPAFSPQD